MQIELAFQDLPRSTAAMLYHATPYHAILYHTIHAMPCHTMPYHAIHALILVGCQWSEGDTFLFTRMPSDGAGSKGMSMSALADVECHLEVVQRAILRCTTRKHSLLL